MATVNGRKTNDRSLIATYAVQGTGTRLPIRKGNDSVVLLYVAEQFHKRVEKLHTGWCWGYAERNVRGYSVPSYHSAGIAIDLNAPEHPLGKRGTFSERQEAEIREILDELDGVVRWGGDYRNRADEMHFEVIGSFAQVARVADKIRGGKITKPKPTKPAGPDTISIRKIRIAGLDNVAGRPLRKFEDVADLQALLNKFDRQHGLNLDRPLTTDGYYGDRTLAAYKRFERKRGFSSADGVSDGAGKGLRDLTRLVKSDRPVVR